MKKISFFLFLLMASGCDNSSSSPAQGQEITIKQFVDRIAGNYWINAEAYNCRRERDAVVRLTENLWMELGGGGPEYFLFGECNMVEYFDLTDPVLRQRYGDGYFWISHTLAFDESTQRITTSFDGIPRSPMKLAELGEDYFVVECGPVYPYPEETEFTQVVFRKQDRASCEARFKEAQSYREVAGS